MNWAGRRGYSGRAVRLEAGDWLVRGDLCQAIGRKKTTHKVHSELLAEEKRRRGAWSQKAWLLRLWVDSALGGDEE